MNNKTLMANLSCIPDFPKKGINFRDVTTLFKNPALTSKVNFVNLSKHIFPRLTNPARAILLAHTGISLKSTPLLLRKLQQKRIV